MAVDGAIGWQGARAGAGRPGLAHAGLPRIDERLLEQLDAERERWLLWVPVALGIGIAAYFSVSSEPSLWQALAGLACTVIVALALARASAVTFFAAAMMWTAVGFAAAKLRSDMAAAPIIERRMSGAIVEGFVELVEFRSGRGQRVTVLVTRLADLDPPRRPFRVRIRVLSGAGDLAPGDSIRLKATLNPPAGPILPGDYDFGRAAWFQRIGAVGYALKPPERIAAAASVPLNLRFFAEVERIRRAITVRIVAALPGERGHIAAALITGERGGISERTNDAYRASGTFHILSISGLHMVIMAGAIFWTIRLGFALLPGLALRMPVKKWAAAAAAVAALGYLLISGSQPATQRSYIMITIGFAAMLADRPPIALRTVALSAIALLVVWPESLLDIGFQMSYAAVVALVAAFEEIRARRPEPDRDAGVLRSFLVFFAGVVLTTLIAGFAVWPFSAYYFHNSQQYAVLGNMVSIPICNMIVMPAALATLMAMPVGLERWPLEIMGLGIDAMTWIAYHVAAVPGALLPVRAIPDASFQLIVVGGIWLALWSRRWRLLGLVAIVAGLGLAPFKPRPDIVVARDGRLVVVRGRDGQLSALKASGTAFELRRILDNDGDARPIAKALEAAAFRCDPLGCRASIGQERLAVIRHPLALADDCASATIVVTSASAPRGCRPRTLLVDQYAVRDRGTHVVHLAAARGAGPLLVTTVEDVRGDRPWSQAAQSRSRVARATSRRAVPSRLAAFAAPALPSSTPDVSRLEDEADGGQRDADD